MSCMTVPLRFVVAALILLGIPAWEAGAVRADEDAKSSAIPSGLPNRAEAVHRQRRMIFADDNSAIHQKTGNTPEGYLAYRLAHTADTHADSIWLSILTGPDALLYDAKVGEVAGKEFYEEYPSTSREESEEKMNERPYGAFFTYVWHNINSLLQVGTDPLKVAVDFGHQHDKEVFACIRMNMSIKDSWHGPDFCTKFKRDHPEYCLGVRGDYEKYGNKDIRGMFWAGLDYEHQPVRDLRVGMIEDIGTRYDVDGIALDFMRWPILFKPSLEDKPVDKRHIEIMNNFFRRVRKRMMEIEVQRGRPLLLGVRVFDTEELSLKMGLDARTWLDEGLIDMLVVGGGYNYYSKATADWAELTSPANVPLYIGRYHASSLERDRAFVTWYRSQGADGMYAFNFKMPKDLATIQEIGDPELDARRDKHYVMSGPMGYLRGHVSAPGIIPFTLKPGEARAVVLVGDDVGRASEEGVLKELILTLKLANELSEEDDIGFKLNGIALENPRWQGDTVAYRLTAPPLTQGASSLEADFGDNASQNELRVIGVDLWVRYHSP